MSNPFQDKPTPTSEPAPIVPGQPPTQPMLGASGAPPAQVPPRKRLGTGAIVAIVAGVLLMACCGVGVVSLLAKSASDDVQGSGADVESTTPTQTGTVTTTAALRTTTQPPPVPEDQTFEGSGADVVELSLDREFAHIATITHQGGRNFVVWSVDANGSEIDLLVNEIGDYSGVRPLDLRETPAALKIEADGAWRIVVQAMQKAPLWPGQSSGVGSAVLLVAAGPAQGLTTVAITHSGESNFAVWVYGARDADLLVNEIGAYSGETILPSWAVVIEIEADGPWTLTET